MSQQNQQPLFRHQQQSIEFGRGQPAFLDASDPGTGKTRVQVELARARIHATDQPILILSPKSSLRATWFEDFRKFAPELTVSLAYASNRDRAFEVAADVYVTNHDAVKWLAAKQKANKKFFDRFSTCVVDESGAYKHYTSQRSRAANLIAPFFEFRAAMNGTLNPNTILDVWNQIYFLDRGQRLGKSFHHFRNQVCVPSQVGREANMVRWEDREGAEELVAHLIRDITIRHAFEDCTDIPPNNEYSVPFVLKPAHMRTYRQMQAAGIASLETGTVSALAAGSVSTKLLQIASGAVYEDEDTYHLVDTDRYEVIMDLLEPRKHSICFFLWKHQKQQLIAAAKARGFTYTIIDGTTNDHEREEAVRLFQAGFYKVLFGHPASMAHSLTLVKAKTTIWASPTYNLEWFMQGNKRIDRIGQDEKTETIVVVAEDTIDEKVYEACHRKRVRLTNLLFELKEAA